MRLGMLYYLAVYSCAPDDKRAAADPATSQKELWRLALDRPDLRPVIAMNPAAPEELRANLLERTQARSSVAVGSPPTTWGVASSGDEGARGRRKRFPMLVVLTLAVTLVLLLAVTVVVLYGGQSPRAESTAPGAGQRAAMQDASVQPGQSEATVAQTQATEPTAPSQRTTPPVTLDALGASGCAAAAEDAGLLVAYGSEYSNGSGWGTAHAEGQLERQIVRLQQACGRNYVMQVATMAERLGATAAVNTTLHKVMATPARPAPQGAFSYDMVASPSGNIMCHLQGEYVSCGIQKFSYQDCGWPRFDMYVGLDGVVGKCGPGVPSEWEII